MEYIIYARRSSEDKTKQIQSIDDQLSWASIASVARNLKILDTFKDSKTATKPGRIGFTEMMELINKRSEPVGIICWKLDRLARNPVDEGAIKYALMEKKITHIITNEKEFHAGTNQILMGVEFGAATQYSIDLSMNVKRGLKGKIVQGWRPNMAPLGYKNDIFALKGHKKIFKDEKSWDNLRKIWDQALTGHYSGPQLLAQANELGLKNRKGGSIALSNLYRILSSPFYAGLIYSEGELVKGAHPPMVTPEEFDQVQLVLNLGSQRRQRVHKNTYAGLIKCGECGGMITAEPPKMKKNKGNGKMHIYHYLRCSKRKNGPKCQQPYLREEKLKEQIIDKLAEIEIPVRIEEWIFEQVRERHKEETQKFSKRRAILQTAFNANETIIDTLTTKLLEGVVDNDTYKLKRVDFEQERIRIKQQMDDYDNNKDDWLEKVEEVFKFAIEAPKAFEKASLERKREILRSLGSNFSMKDKKLVIKAILPFTSIKSSVAKTKLVFETFEPELNRMEKPKDSLSDILSSIWSG